jgi:hypothetical protein
MDATRLEPRSMTARATHAVATISVSTLLLAASAFAGAEGDAATTVEETPVAVAAPEAAEPDAPEQHLRIRLRGTGAIVDGDVAQFQQRHRIPDDFSGGIDELLYTTEIGEDTTLELEGRAILDNRDYLAALSIENEDKGFFRAGYRQFRTWYDGRGGYYPPTDAFFVPFDPKLGIDRGEAWLTGGMILPEGFRLNLGYRYLSREGSKSSTIWGDSSSLGLAPPNNRRNIVPAFYEIDERRHQVDVAVSRETETSEVAAGIFFERMNLDNKRNVVRAPGELGVERRFTERDDSHGDLIVARTHGTRRLLGDKLTISGAYAYNDIDLDIGGSRIYGANFHAAFDPLSPNRQQRDEGFFDLHGGSTMREHVGNVSLSARPFEDLQILSALRVRGENRHGETEFVETNVGGSPTFTTALEDLHGLSDTEEMSYAEELELRYRGIDNVVLYARAQWEENDGEIFEREVEPVAPAVLLERDTEIDRFLQRYGTGAKIYPARWVHLSGEYSFRRSDYDYEHRIDSTPNDPVGPPPSGDRYPAFFASQTFSTHDVSLRTTLRLPHDIGLVLRYDWLNSTIDTRGDGLDEIESAESRAHVFGGTLTLQPLPGWWARLGTNVVRSTTDTSANNYPTPVAGFLPSFDNDYVTTNLASGFAIDADTELELAYSWLEARNYKNLWASTVSYGSRFTEHGAGVQVVRRISDRTKIGAGYSFFHYDEAFAGGEYDHAAHLISTTVEYSY